MVWEGQASIFSVFERVCASPLPESELELTASLSTVVEWILLGAMGGFLSVAGSEAVTWTATGSLFSSPGKPAFSSEQRRLEGEGLEEGRTVVQTQVIL